MCCGPVALTKVGTQQSQACAHSSSRGLQRALLPPCKLSGLAALRIGGKNECPRKDRGDAFVVRMGIRAVKSFDAAFQLTTEVCLLEADFWTTELFLGLGTPGAAELGHFVLHLSLSQHKFQG